MPDTKKIQKFHVLLKQLGIMHHKKDILAGYDVESTKELSNADMDDLIYYLEGNLKYYDYNNFQWGGFYGKNQQHMYILALCHQLGWTVFDESKNKTIADIQRLGGWIKSRCKIRKPLRHQSRRECQITIFQLEQILNKKQNEHTKTGI